MTLLLLAACLRTPPPGPAPVERCTLLTINDTYRIEPLPDGAGGMARVRTVRERLQSEGPVVLLHAGDFLAPSLMSRMWGGAQMVEVLGVLDGDTTAMDPHLYAVVGNHEFDAGKAADGPKLDAMIASSGFTWLAANVVFGKGADGAAIVEDPKLTGHARFDCGGIAFGVVGVTLPAKAAYVERFDDPVETTGSGVAALRAAGAEVVVALTHQAKDADVAMLEALGEAGPDLVVGGHEHAWLKAEGAGRPVYKADADARSAWRLAFSRVGGRVGHEASLLQLGADVPEDPEVEALVDAKLSEHDHLYCQKRELPDGCLVAQVGTAGVPLVAEELEIRRFETNFGDWIADRARAAFPGAQVAMLNSGSLRLNHDLAPGPVRRQDVEEMFAYPTPLVQVEIDGATLEKAVCRARQEWSGNGHWLQISGFAWAHDPVADTASKLTWAGTGKPIGKAEKVVAVVPSFLVDPAGSRDGYTMLPTPPSLTGPDLKELVLAAMAEGPIAPAVEGRICNTTRPGPCLAVEGPAIGCE